MKIITVNLPVSYIKMIEGLIGENALYPSRSELVRVAVRDFLIREISALEQFKKAYPQCSDPIKPKIDSNLFVQIPLSSQSNGTTEYKTFRLGRKENNDSEKLELDEYVERNDMNYSKHSFPHDMTPQLKPIQPPIQRHVPQILAEPEYITIGGKTVKVVKR